MPCIPTAINYNSIVSFPDPAPLRGKEGLVTFVNFLGIFESCDTCLCACPFQQRARDRELRIVSCPGGGVWVAVTRDLNVTFA